MLGTVVPSLQFSTNRPDTHLPRSLLRGYNTGDGFPVSVRDARERHTSPSLSPRRSAERRECRGAGRDDYLVRHANGIAGECSAPWYRASRSRPIAPTLIARAHSCGDTTRVPGSRCPCAMHVSATRVPLCHPAGAPRGASVGAPGRDDYLVRHANGIAGECSAPWYRASSFRPIAPTLMCRAHSSGGIARVTGSRCPCAMHLSATRVPLCHPAQSAERRVCRGAGRDPYLARHVNGIAGECSTPWPGLPFSTKRPEAFAALT